MLPINHLKRTLDRCCGQWEFASYPKPDSFLVRFLNTGELHRCFIADEDGTWLVSTDDKPNGFLASRLNGLKRDDSGEMAPLYETPDKVAL